MTAQTTPKSRKPDSKRIVLQRLVRRVDYLEYRVRWERASASSKISELKRTIKILNDRVHLANRTIDRAQKALRELHHA